MEYSDRPTLRSQQTVTVNAGDVLLLGPNPRRTGLLIGTPTGHTVYLSFVGPATGGTGIALNPDTQPLVLTHQLLGDSITEEIRASCPAGVESITVVEFFR